MPDCPELEGERSTRWLTKAVDMGPIQKQDRPDVLLHGDAEGLNGAGCDGDGDCTVLNCQRVTISLVR